MRQSVYYLGNSHAAVRLVLLMFMMAVGLAINVSHVLAQNQPSAEIFVDGKDVNFPLRLTIAVNTRRDIASMTVRATDPTNIVAFDGDTNKYVLYPIGETGMGISTIPDTNMLPTGSNITIARFLTDNTTRQQKFTVDFLNRNGESVASQTINVGVAASVTLAEPCTRSILDLTTGLNVSGNILPPGHWDPFWTMCSSSLPTYVLNNTFPAWSNDPNSRWIGVNYYPPNVIQGETNNGIYSYCREFCVRTQCKISLRLLIFADDSLQQVLIDNTPIFSSPFSFPPGFYNYTFPLVLNLSSYSLSPGSHRITFITKNSASWQPNPSGLRLAAGSNMTVVSGIFGQNNPFQLGLAGNACCTPKGRLYGWKRWDKNCDGKEDGSDEYLPGWVITATPAGGGVPTIATTNSSSGKYEMLLLPGTYTITETIQAGWSPSVSAGPYTVTILPGQEQMLNFLNCKQPTCEELFTVGRSDSVCCTGRFSLSNAGNTVVTSLSFVATGGVVTGVNTGCQATSSPNLTAGLSSGTFTFNPGCANMAVEFDAKSTTATGKICVKWTATFKQGTKTFTCTKEICLNCIRMPKDCKVPLQVTPDMYPPLNTESRTFTISNVKVPASQISSVDVQFINEPTPQHSGGGLIVDGTPRNWAFGNSGGYNRVRMNCSGATNPHGTAASNWVKFNLGVDNTINYSGLILVKIGYCDGDTCFTEYQWKAKNVKNIPNSIDTAIAIKNPRILRFKVISPDSTRSIGIKVGDSLATIQAVTAPCGSLENDCPDISKQFRAATKGNIAHLSSFSGTCLPCCECPPEDFTVTVVYTPGTDKVDPKVPVRLSFFDRNATEIGQAERELTSTPTSVVNNDDGNSSSNEILIKSISPNPSNDNSVLRFVLDESSSSVNITLVDAQGRVLSTLVNNQRMDAGEHTLPFNTSSLTSGVYILRITADGIVVSSKFTVIR